MLKHGSISEPLTIYALADQASYGGLVGRQRSNSTVATLRNTSYGAVVILDLSANSRLPGDQVRESLFHEYTHFLCRVSSLTHYPYWLSEGIAEFYSTIQFNPDGSTELGRVPFLLAYTLKNQAPLPLAEVLTKTESDIAGKEQNLGLRLHAGAWMVTHWLMLNAEQASLSRYLQAHTDGAGPEKEIQQVLNLPFEELHSIYRRLPREGFAYVRYPAQEVEHLQEPVVHAIPRSQALGQLGHLMAISDASDETLLALIDYARAEGTDIPALVAIQAVAKAKNGYVEEAELLLRGIAPVDQTQLWYKDAEAAVAMAEMLSSEKGYENFADLKQLRNKYLALVNSHSSVPAYWHRLAICLQMLGYPRGLPAHARAGLLTSPMANGDRLVVCT